MKELRYTSQFKKDLKRILNQPKKLKALNEVLTCFVTKLLSPKNIGSIHCKVIIPDALNVILRVIFF